MFRSICFHLIAKGWNAVLKLNKSTSAASSALAAFIVAMSIFCADYATGGNFGIATLYCVVVMLLADAASVKGLALVGSSCAILSIVTALGDPRFPLQSEFPMLTEIVSLFAVTAFCIRQKLLSVRLGEDASYTFARKSWAVTRVELNDQAANDFRGRAFAQMTTAFVHDLSQPLTAAITNTEASLHWLQAEKPNLVEARGAIRNAVENQRRAGRILTRLRNDANPYPKRNEELALGDVAERAIAQVKASMATSFLDLQLELDSALPLVSGDKVTLEKVFAELLLEVVGSLGDASTGFRLIFRLSKYTNEAGASEVFAEIGDRSSYSIMDQLSPLVPTTDNEHSWVQAGSNLSLCRDVIEAHSWILQSFVGLNAARMFRVRIPIEEGV